MTSKATNGNVSTTAITHWPNNVSNTGTTCYTFEGLFAELNRPVPWWRSLRNSVRRAAGKPRRAVNEVRWGWQRARRGYSEADTWGFDHYLSGVIVGGLERLRERAIGYPNGMTAESWDAALDQMIASFSLAHHDAVGDAAIEREFQKGARLFVKHYFALWD